MPEKNNARNNTEQQAQKSIGHDKSAELQIGQNNGQPSKSICTLNSILCCQLHLVVRKNNNTKSLRMF